MHQYFFSFLQHLLELCPRLEHIDLSFCSGVGSEVMDNLSDRFPNVDICACDKPFEE